MAKREETDLIGPTEASQILKTSAQTVRNYARRRLLNPVPIDSGSRQLYRRDDVERLREQLAAEKRKGPRQAKGIG